MLRGRRERDRFLVENDGGRAGRALVQVLRPGRVHVFAAPVLCCAGCYGGTISAQLSGGRRRMMGTTEDKEVQDDVISTVRRVT